VPSTLRADDPPWIGPFRIEARLGRGGMGEVYFGRDFDGSAAAVKVLQKNLTRDEALLRRFSREVEVIRQVGGPSIARLVDADLEADPPWLATEYVNGPSLARWVRARGPLALTPLRTLASGLLDALQAIHDVGVVHRDLTPSNVMLADDGPKVVDFGIALTTGGTALTRTGMVVGTTFWMAPEQAQGHPVSGATDVFAWGCVMTFAAIGQSPFGEGRPHEVLERIVRGDPDLGEIPDALRPSILASLQKDPAARPSVEKLRGDVARWTSPSSAVGST
jgi:serine/threonine protein kinase